MLEKYLNKALKSAEAVECGKEFTMKSLLTEEERVEIGSYINDLGKLFKRAIDDEQAKNVVYVGKTPQNENVYQKI